MDEVLSHALIVPAGERLFDNADMPLPVAAGQEEKPARAIN
jgi:hypothetical protein